MNNVLYSQAIDCSWGKSLDESRKQMKNASSVFERHHSRQLLHGRTKRLGLLEMLHMKIIGQADGKIGIPKQTDDGVWTSGTICKEITAYEEFCDKIWGDLQIRLHWGHSRSDVLVDELLRLEEKIKTVQSEEENYETNTLSPNYRKRGEDNLSDSQIAARRKREASKEREQRLAKLARLQEAYEEKYEELSFLHGFIVESSNAARHICERVMNHTKQRIDVYWRAAYRVHPDNDSMPVVIAPLKQSNAESTYLENHEGHDSAISALLIQCKQRVDSIRDNNLFSKEVA